eukprot:4405796-Pleurochrysis_carterae.AAC.2
MIALAVPLLSCVLSPVTSLFQLGSVRFLARVSASCAAALCLASQHALQVARDAVLEGDRDGIAGNGRWMVLEVRRVPRATLDGLRGPARSCAHAHAHAHPHPHPHAHAHAHACLDFRSLRLTQAHASACARTHFCKHKGVLGLTQGACMRTHPRENAQPSTPSYNVVSLSLLRGHFAATHPSPRVLQ